MARLIFVLGHPGTGKSSSLRNFKKDEIGYISVTGKELPFRTDINPVVAKTAAQVIALIKKSAKPIIVIDDVNYLFTFQVFGRSQEKDQFQVFRDIGNDFYKLVEAITNKDTDQNIYLFGHIEINEKNLVQLKTAGKTIRDNITPEGLTNIVFESVVDLSDFVFRVKSDGSGVKSPIEMFESDTIPNDLKVVNDKINAYYKKGAK
ncbi:MAG: ATP-binding protein [Pseudomonadota bacterium]